jgi:hypothetical protein
MKAYFNKINSDGTTSLVQRNFSVKTCIQTGKELLYPELRPGEDCILEERFVILSQL